MRENKAAGPADRAGRHPDWVLGFVDETWWSRLAQPAMHAWPAGSSMRPLAHALPKGAPDPKALGCYGLLRTDGDRVLLRFVQGRPGSHVTTAFLAWLARRRADERTRVLVLSWDNASWHRSREVRTWIHAHNQRAKREGGCVSSPAACL
jgi:hypothetical protein